MTKTFKNSDLRPSSQQNDKNNTNKPILTD
jgi:hypothetical protein